MLNLLKFRIALLLLVGPLASAGFFARVAAQVPGIPAANLDDELLEEGLVDENSLFVPAPREVLRPFLRAQKAVNDKEYERAVALIGESLSDSGAEDYLIRVPGEDGLAVSLRSRANELLGKIPKRHRELYELRYGTQAKQLLERAVAESDFLLMAQVMGRYFYTPAGYDATMLIGYYQLDQGQPLAAASSFARIVNDADARKIHDPEASVLLATCWMLANAPDKAEQVLIDLKQRRPNQSVRFMDRERPLFKSNSEALGWLQALVGDSPLIENRVVGDWMMYRGNPQRNANSGSGFPLGSYRWYVPTMNDPDVELLAKEKIQDLIFADAAMIPSVQPIAVNDIVIMRTFDRMIGVDFATGRRIWTFPPDDTDVFLEPEDRVDEVDRQTTNKEPLALRMWQDSVFGQSSSDGKSIFVVPQPGFVGARPQMIFAGGSPITHPLSHRQFNELKAVDVSREGAFKWGVGGKSGLQEPKLAEAFFLGPPLPLEDSLYAVCQQREEILLVVLDPETGKLQWSRQLASVETVGSIVSPNAQERRLAGATPSFSDGLLICPTGIGAITAVDISTRSLIWGFQYGAAKSKRSSLIAHDENSSSPIVNTRWNDSTVTISDGCVLYTPADSNNLITLDLLTGRPLWETGKGISSWIQREDSLFIGCVDQRHAILIGMDYIRSIDLQQGEEAWRLQTSQFGRPSGHGYSNRGFYYLPMTSERLLKVDVREGKLVQAIRTNGILGNLICYRGDVISHGVDHLAAFPQDEPNQRLLAKAEERGELTPDQLAIKTQLLFQSNNVKEAALCITKAHDQQPKPYYEKIITDVIVSLMEVDFDYAVLLSEKYADKFSDAVRPRIQSARVDGLIKQNSDREAFDYLLGLLVPLVESGETSVYLNNLAPLGGDQAQAAGPPDRFLNSAIRFDRWLEARLKYLFDKASPEQREEFTTAIDQLLREHEHLTLIQRFRLYQKIGFGNVGEVKRVELAQSLEKLNEPLRAWMVRTGGNDSTVETDHSRELDQKRLNQLIEESLLEQVGSAITGAWNSGIVNHEFLEPADRDLNLIRTMTRNEVQLVENNNRFFDQFLYRYFGQTGEFEILDRHGKSVSRFATRDSTIGQTAVISSYIVGEARIDGFLMLVNIGAEVFAVDLLKAFSGDDPLLWSFDQSQGQAVGTVHRQSLRNIWGATVTQMTSANLHPIIVSSPNQDGICYLEKSSLVCVDPLSGKTLWQRFNVRADSQLFLQDQLVTVWDPTNRTAEALGLLTGELRKQVEIPKSLGSPWTNNGSRLLLSSSRFVKKPDSGASEQEESSDENVFAENSNVDMIKTMTLVDVSSGETIWQREFDEHTHASLLRNEKIAVLSDNGELQFVDFLTGQIESTTQIKVPSKDLQDSVMMELSQTPTDFLVKLHCDKSTNYRFTNSQGVTLNGLRYLHFWNGYLVSIDRKSRKLNWDAPVRLQHFNFASNQPYDAPLLLLQRRVDRPGGIRADRYWSQLVAVDLRNGRTVANAVTKYSSSNDYHFEADIEHQTVTYYFNDKTLQFRLTNETPPPSPVAHLTSDNSIAFEQEFVQPLRVLTQISDEARARLLERIRARQASLEKRRTEMKLEMELQKKGQ